MTDANNFVLPTELVKLSSLKPHPRNYLTHPEDQLDHIVESIKTNGLYRNIVVAEDSTILAGHGVVEGCKRLQIEEVRVVRLPFGPDDTRALKVLAGDNEVTRLREIDDRKLTEILRDIFKSHDKALLGTGFDEMKLANLVYVTRPSNEIKDFNAAAEWVGLPVYHEDDPTRDAELLIVVSFVNREDRERFVTENKIRIFDRRGDRKWSTSWPYRERNDLRSVKFEDVKK